MANNLPIEKKTQIVSMLAEDAYSIRAIERITGVHRDTVMRLVSCESGKPAKKPYGRQNARAGLQATLRLTKSGDSSARRPRT